MENTVKDIYSEVYAILNMLGKEYINKLPKDIYNIIKEEKSTEYNPVYATTVALDKQDVKKETISIIAFLHLNYWCNEDEKIKLRELFDENEDKYQEEQEVEQEDEEIQDDNNEIEIGKEFLSMIVYKEENFAQRIFNKIRKLFSRKKEMYE
jgi:hypothetical protein